MPNTRLPRTQTTRNLSSSCKDTYTYNMHGTAKVLFQGGLLITGDWISISISRTETNGLLLYKIGLKVKTAAKK